MSDDKHLVPAVIERREVPERMHPVVAAAIQAGPDAATIRELLTMQREYEAEEARRAYTTALARVKADMPAVLPRDGKNTQQGTRYTTLAKIIDTITGPLADHGFSIGGDGGVHDGLVRVTVTLTHHMGHHEGLTLEAAPDKGAAKKDGKGYIRSDVEAIGATMTYLRRYATSLLLGLASGDVPDVEDGAGVDAFRNLRAVGKLADRGVTLEDAQAQVGKTVDAWTRADLAALAAWLKTRGEDDQPGPQR